MSNSIVLVRRGDCTEVQKATNAAARGAKYIIFYNSEPGTYYAPVAEAGLLASAVVVPETGEKWVSLLEARSEIVLSMTGPEASKGRLREF